MPLQPTDLAHGVATGPDIDPLCTDTPWEGVKKCTKERKERMTNAHNVGHIVFRVKYGTEVYTQLFFRMLYFCRVLILPEFTKTLNTFTVY